MSTTASPRPGTRAAGPATGPADVLVVFGITGDLAKQMTLHSLYRLEARGLLTCPVVGVAVDDWTVDDLRERAREAIVASGERLDPQVFERFAARLSYLAGDFADPATFERLATRLADAQRPVFYLEIPPFLFSTVVKGLADAGLTASARVVVEKPFGHDLSSARALARGDARVPRRAPALPDRPLPRKARPHGDPPAALRERDPRAGLAPQPRRERRDHDGRELRRRGPRALLRPGRRAARRRRQPPDADRRGHRHGGAGRPRSRHVQERAVRGVPRDAAGRPRALRARPARRLPGDRRGRRRLHDRDVRRDAAGDRQLALVGGAHLHPHRQAPPRDADRAAAGVQATAPPRLRSEGPPGGAQPARRQARSVDRRPDDAPGAARRARRAGDDQPRHELRDRGRRRPGALRGAPACRHGGRTACGSSDRTASRRRGA